MGKGIVCVMGKVMVWEMVCGMVWG